jgi:FlaA1/EpsC-like NDP-sugar epimerase
MAGRVPDEDIRIVFTGLRPGEKLHEELLSEQEERTQVVRNRVRVACSPPPPADLAERLVQLRTLAGEGRREEVLQMLRVLIPTFGPLEATVGVPVEEPPESPARARLDRPEGEEQVELVPALCEVRA